MLVGKNTDISNYALLFIFRLREIIFFLPSRTYVHRRTRDRKNNMYFGMAHKKQFSRINNSIKLTDAIECIFCVGIKFTRDRK